MNLKEAQPTRRCIISAVFFLPSVPVLPPPSPPYFSRSFLGSAVAERDDGQRQSSQQVLEKAEELFDPSNFNGVRDATEILLLKASTQVQVQKNRELRS